MINYNDYFVYINFNSSDLITEINQFVQNNQNKFFISKQNQCRIDFNKIIKNNIRDIFKFPISDLGVFKNIPRWSYPIHYDSQRKFAVNLLLSDSNNEFEALFYNDDKTINFPIPYIKNQWVLVNTKKLHSVKNNSKTDIRYVISIGCESVNYNTIVESFKKSNNIGLIT